MIAAWERSCARRANAAARAQQQHVAPGDAWNALRRVALYPALRARRA